MSCTGGGDGRKGRNTLVRADESEEDLGGKKSVQVLSGVYNIIECMIPPTLGLPWYIECEFLLLNYDGNILTSVCVSICLIPLFPTGNSATGDSRGWRVRQTRGSLSPTACKETEAPQVHSQWKCSQLSKNTGVSIRLVRLLVR